MCWRVCCMLFRSVCLLCLVVFSHPHTHTQTHRCARRERSAVDRGAHRACAGSSVRGGAARAKIAQCRLDQYCSVVLRKLEQKGCGTAPEQPLQPKLSATHSSTFGGPFFEKPHDNPMLFYRKVAPKLPPPKLRKGREINLFTENTCDCSCLSRAAHMGA